MSVRPLLDDEKFEKLKEMSEEFKNGVGKKLQLYLWLKSWWSSNYVSINCRLAITILNFLCLLKYFTYYLVICLAFPVPCVIIIVIISLIVLKISVEFRCFLVRETFCSFREEGERWGMCRIVGGAIALLSH